ncbi:MAG: hypothetical protein ACREI3_11710 [Nitrospirales bacterium]
MTEPGPIRTWLPTLVGGVLVVGVGTLLMWLTASHMPHPVDPEEKQKAGATESLGAPGKRVGTSALSHGGPAPAAPPIPSAPPASRGPLAIGQQVVVIGLAAGHSASGESPIPFVSGPGTPTSPEPRPRTTVSPGTPGEILAVWTNGETARRPGEPAVTLYQVRLADGRTGWLPGSTLQVRSPGDGLGGF